MIYFVEVAESGQLLRSGSAPFARLQAVPGYTPAWRAVAAPVLDVARWYWSGDALQPMPPQPSPAHTFDYAAKQWVLDEAAAWERVRRERDRRLAACDWVTLRARDTGQDVPPEWLEYRQALRDVTQQADPLAIVWPTAPG